MVTKATVTMIFERECKSCVLFKALTRNNVSRNIYLNNEAYEALGKPQTIRLQVEREE